MSNIRLIGSVFAITLALSTIGASAARATEGPFYKVSRATLKTGEIRTLKATVKSTLSFEVVGRQTIACKILKFRETPAALIRGQYFSGESATSEQRFEYKDCTVTDNGTMCEIPGHEFSSKPTYGYLGYSDANKTGPLLIVYEPTSGTTFAEVQFNGSCTLTTTKITGYPIGVIYTNGQAVEAGKEEERVQGEIHFSAAATEILTEYSNKLTSSKSNLLAFESPARALGELVLELSPNFNWGVFT
jgi:hypothetical protein